MKSLFAAATLALAAQAVSEGDVQHPADTRVDVENSTKFVGRVNALKTFDEWVDDERPQPDDVDLNPCSFQWLCAFPWGAERVYEALYIAHSCPTFFVHTMRFNALLQGENISMFHTDETVRRVEEEQGPNNDWTLVNSFIKLPKNDSTANELANDDAYLFDEAGEPDWTYAYFICLAWEDCDTEEFNRDWVAPSEP